MNVSIKGPSGVAAPKVATRENGEPDAPLHNCFDSNFRPRPSSSPLPVRLLVLRVGVFFVPVAECRRVALKVPDVRGFPQLAHRLQVPRHRIQLVVRGSELLFAARIGQS